MLSKLTWQKGMKFMSEAGGHGIHMDAKAPIGQSSAQTPKELVLAGLGGCTAMDVVSLLKKHKQDLTAFEVTVDAETTKTGMPTTFTQAVITFSAVGPVDPKVLVESVHLSQTKFCGVSAMLAKVFPIEYKVVLNGQEVGRGKAHFD